MSIAARICICMLHVFACSMPCVGETAASPSSTWRPERAIVVAARAEAAEAGRDMLRQGGNAFDAAAAIALSLGVVEPGSSGIGGGGFFLLYLAKQNRFVMIDARECAPQLAGHGEPYRNGVSSIDGPQSAGVPGLLAGIERMHAEHGLLPRTVVTAPAIHWAERGFRASPRLQRMLHWRAKAFNEAARKVFLTEDGWIRQPALARTLRRYAQLGAEDFYRGETARRLVSDMKQDGGWIRLADLANYRALPREPVHIHWRGYHLVSAALPSSGGMVLAQILGMLANDKLAAMPRIDRDMLLIESMRLAYRERNRHLGDADFVNIPSDYLAPERLRRLRAQISLTHATHAEDAQTDIKEGRDTTHFSVIDSEGNMVAATLSINYPFGSAYLSPSTGVLLNDEMDDFATRPGEANAYGLVQGAANAVAPGKRMLSSMTPTMVIGQRRLAILGTPGGSRIISMVLLSALGMMLQDGEPEEWVQRGRFHHQYLPDVVQYEQGAFDARELRELRKRGYTLRQVRDYGNMQAIFCQRKEKVHCLGLSDRRGEGVALQVNPSAKRHAAR